MSIRKCAAVNEDGTRCGKYKGLQSVQIETKRTPLGLLQLPDRVVVELCPKHFVMRKAKEQL